MNKIYRFSGATLALLAAGMFFGRKFELNRIFTDNDYLNSVWRMEQKGSDDRVFLSNQPWI
jgi:hypothetical protein